MKRRPEPSHASTGAVHAPDRLEHLHTISKLLLRMQDVSQMVDKVSDVIFETMPLRSAFCCSSETDAPPSVV